MVNVPAYLDRIGYTGPTAPTAETLREIHRHHMQTVPFENLDIFRARPIVIDADAFVDKIVNRRRGGFCYELNGAFAELLAALGFQVTLLSGHFQRPDGSRGPEFDHLALRVDLDEPWLADVGFGDSFVEPLLLKTGIEQGQNGELFRIVEAGDSFQVERQQKAEYLFTLVPRQLSDFAAMCQYHQTSPDSHFTQKRMCSRATSTGRITLSDLRLIITENGIRQERILDSEQDWHATLQQYFGIVLSTPTL